MDPLSLGTTILKAIQALLGLKDTLKKASMADRAPMADLFEKIAVCLEAAAADIRAGVYPQGRCQELLSYATALPARMQGVVPAGEAQEIALALQGAYTVEGLYSIRDQAPGLAQLSALEEAAGTIRGLGNLLRV